MQSHSSGRKPSVVAGVSCLVAYATRQDGRLACQPARPVQSLSLSCKAELVYRDSFSDLRDLQAKLSDYVHWYNNFRIHSTLGYMSPVEFRKAGLILSKPSK